MKEFVEYGVKIVNKELILEDLDEYDLLKIDSLKKILKEVNANIYIARFVSKDATASCFQHLIKILGGSNEDALT
jgi:hypothetical protein